MAKSNQILGNKKNLLEKGDKLYALFEIKDDPKLPNYKPDVTDRYDTQYYAYLMAKMLNKSGFETIIGTLPDSWRVQGKIDIDGALAQRGHATEVVVGDRRGRGARPPRGERDYG